MKTRDDLFDFICVSLVVFHLSRAENSLAKLDKSRSFQLVDDILIHYVKVLHFLYSWIYEKLI